MISKKAMVGAAALALAPLALMAPANAYYRIGDCKVDPGAADAGVTLTVVSQVPHWDVTGHITDGHGRTWRYQFFSNGDPMTPVRTTTGGGDVSTYWVPRGGSEHIRFHAENAAGTVQCNAALDT